MCSISGIIVFSTISLHCIKIADVKPTPWTVHSSRVQTNTLTLMIFIHIVCKESSFAIFEHLLILIAYENSRSSLNPDFCRGLALNGRPVVRQILFMAYKHRWNRAWESSATPYRLPMNFLDLSIWIFKAHCVFDDYCVKEAFAGKRCSASLTKAIEFHCECEIWTLALTVWTFMSVFGCWRWYVWPVNPWNGSSG